MKNVLFGLLFISTSVLAANISEIGEMAQEQTQQMMESVYAEELSKCIEMTFRLEAIESITSENLHYAMEEIKHRCDQPIEALTFLGSVDTANIIASEVMKYVQK